MSSDPEQRMHADSARMVLEAMERAGIGKGEPVALIGHSQGGIVAAAIASDMADRYTFEHVVTLRLARRQPSDPGEDLGHQR